MRPSFLKRRIVLLTALSLAMLAGFASACTPMRHLLTTADPLAMGPQASPPLFASLPEPPGPRRQAWEARRPALMEQLSAQVYGAAPPAPARVTPGAWSALSRSVQPGRRTLSSVEISPQGGSPFTLRLALVAPDDETPVRGVVLVPSECGLRAALHDPAMPAPTGYTPGYCNAEGWLADTVGAVFGEWIAGPPVARLLERGYAVAAWHESDVAPDNAELHASSLRRLGLDPDGEARPGVISLWAWTISRAADALSDHPRLYDAPLIAYGHSRRGKAVLLAAARDERIAITLSHQSGTGGAALQRDHVGEPIRSITRTYPHWFAPADADYAAHTNALPLDQHALLALIAPRAVLLGGAWRDTWSDPAGAFRAADAASEAWLIYGQAGLQQARMEDFDPAGGVANHIRPGLHGVTDEDWTAFLAFMDAHTPD